MKSITWRGLAATALVAVGGAMITVRADQVPTDAMDVRPLLIRAEVPAVTLRTAEGADFDLAAAVKKKPSIVVFYRGGW